MKNELCICGSGIPAGDIFCRVCGTFVAKAPGAATKMDAGFEGDDAPTRVTDPEFIRERVAADRARVELAATPRVAARNTKPIPPWVPMPKPAPVRESGFRNGLFLGIGVAGFAFGLLTVGAVGIALAATTLWKPSSTAIPASIAVREAAPAPIERIAPIERVAPVAAPVVVKAPVAVAGVEATPAPVVVEKAAPVVAKVVAPIAPVVVAVATPVPEKPKPVVEKAKAVVVAKVAAPKPAPRVVAAAPSRPLATPAPMARPSHDELLALATSARRVATPTPAPVVVAAAPAPAAPFNPGDDVVAEPSAAAAAANDAELDNLLSTTPATPVAVAKKAPAPARDSAERVIHSRKGDKPVRVNANIALTRADGKTLVGKLVGVDGGFVDVKTGDAQLRIAETDVVDAATY